MKNEDLIKTLRTAAENFNHEIALSMLLLMAAERIEVLSS